MNVTTIVLINDVWMTALSWELWVKHYCVKGYRVIAADWPGRDSDVEQLGRDPNMCARVGLTKVVDHYEQIIRKLETPPVIIGHGFGALVTQILLDRGWGAAGVAIASAPPKGVLSSLLTTLTLGFRTLLLSPRRFYREFANTHPEKESVADFQRYIVPASSRILLQTAFANLIPHAPSTVNFRNDTRAPLLLVAGGKDHITPPSLINSNFDLYRESKAETDYKEFPGESHVTFLQETKVADYVLGWALCRVNGSKLTAVRNQSDSWSVQL